VQGQGPKAALLIAALEHVAFGVTGEKEVLNLDVGRELVAIDDYEAAVDFFVAAHVDVHERTARLALALFGGAGADPELERYLDDLIANISLQTRRIYEIVETAAVLCSVDTYLRVTHRDGWSADAYRTWCRRMLVESVFVAPQVH
jgi:hypothetical protein